jgi:hypothetical protein
VASDYPKRRSDLSVRVVEGETVIFDRHGGLIHQLNPTASWLWERCDGHSTIDDLVHQLIQAFDVEPETATRDVTAMMLQFQQLNLLECDEERGDHV